MTTGVRNGKGRGQTPKSSITLPISADWHTIGAPAARPSILPSRGNTFGSMSGSTLSEVVWFSERPKPTGDCVAVPLDTVIMVGGAALPTWRNDRPSLNPASRAAFSDSDNAP